MIHFSHILYVETFTVVIDILQIEAKILKQVARIFLVSLNFINCRICYLFHFFILYFLMEMCSSNTKTYLLINLTAELTPRAFISRSEICQKTSNTETFSQAPCFPKYTIRFSRRLQIILPFKQYKTIFKAD